MRYLITLASVFLFSCNSNGDKVDAFSLKQWILDNQELINKDIETIIKNDPEVNKRDSNWLSSSIATTIYASNSLGALAKVAGDSTECIVVELIYYKDRARKREIMVGAEDSSCLEKLQSIKLETDSVGNLIFGKAIKPIYLINTQKGF